MLANGLLLACLCAGFRTSTAFSSDSLVIAREGKTPYVVVRADQATEPEKLAVRELTNFLGRVTGASFPVVTESALSGDVRGIYVGWTKFAARSGIEAPSSARRNGSFGAWGRISSSTGGRPRGTLYAVYEFLEQQVGCHWLDRDTEIVPSRPTLEFPKLQIQAKPYIWMRDIYLCLSPECCRRATWQKRQEVPDAEQAQRRESPGVRFPRRMPHLLPVRERLTTGLKRIRSIFSLNAQGKRLPAKDGERAGTTVPDAPGRAPWIVENSAEVIAKDRGKRPGTAAATADLRHQPERCGHCQCANCQAIAEREGAESGPMIDFINAIADGIEKDYPDILLQTFAYNRTEPPPKTLKPRDNVIVRWCDVYSVVDLVRPLNHPYNSKNYGEILGWGKIAPHLAIWDYWISYGYYQFPTPYCMIQCIGPDMKLFADMHAETMFCESEEDHEPRRELHRAEVLAGIQADGESLPAGGAADPDLHGRVTSVPPPPR